MGSSTSGKKHKKQKKHKHHRSNSTSDEESVTFDLTHEESQSSHSHHRKHKKHKEHKAHREHKHKHHHHHERERERRALEEEYAKQRPEVIDVQELDSDSSDCVEVVEVEAASSQKSVSKSAQRDVYEHVSTHRRDREDSRIEQEEIQSVRVPREETRREYRDDVRRVEVRREVREEPRREELRRDIRDYEHRREDIRREVREEPRREAREDPRREMREDFRHEEPRREVRDDYRRVESRRDGRDEAKRDPRDDTRYASRREDDEYVASRHRERPPTPPPPKVSRATPPPPRLSKRRHEYDEDEHNAYNDGPTQSKSRRMRTPPPPERSASPIPENGAGDVLSIEETNKLRAKLGLKPLEIDPQPSKHTAKERKGDKGNEKDLSKYKDEWGEFLHKPADNLKEKAEAEKMREKLKQRKEKRQLEDRLNKIRTLGESDDEVDDVSKWVQRSKRVVDEKKEADKRAKALEEMDEEFGVNVLMEQEKRDARRNAYSDKNLKGLRVEHDIENFTEGRTVILTLKDKDVLDEENDDTLVNVNMIDDERYRKNVETKKQNPLSYGYNVYEEQYDQFGNPIDRGILEKYDEDIDGKPKKKKNFVIGEDLEYQQEQKRKLLEIKTKLEGKRLETLADIHMEMARDTFSETELATFKKPKKKVRKLRQKLKADDLLPLNDEPVSQNLGSRSGRRQREDDDVNDGAYDETMETDVKPNVKGIKFDDLDDDLERVLSKARKLKQKENLIKKPLSIDLSAIKQEIKTEPNEAVSDDNIVLNSTAEFCRTLGDIPTYGMSGNRNVDGIERMEMDEKSDDENDDELPSGSNQHKNDELIDAPHGTWNSVNPEEFLRPIDIEIGGEGNGEGVEEVAILDEEPDVGAGVANALRLALSKGYLEKEERKRPSNTKMAHLQAKNYSIEDKSAGDDDKIGRRDRFHSGPIMDFRDKDNFKPNVKLEYIDDNGRILNLKEAFRYLSHKFHGKGPGKNKIEKRLKKMEQEGLMKTMSSTDTPLGTLTMLQQKQKETKTPYVVLSGGKQTPGSTTISKFK